MNNCSRYKIYFKKIVSACSPMISPQIHGDVKNNQQKFIELILRARVCWENLPKDRDTDLHYYTFSTTTDSDGLPRYDISSKSKDFPTFGFCFAVSDDGCISTLSMKIGDGSIDLLNLGNPDTQRIFSQSIEYESAMNLIMVLFPAILNDRKFCPLIELAKSNGAVQLVQDGKTIIFEKFVIDGFNMFHLKTPSEINPIVIGESTIDGSREFFYDSPDEYAPLLDAKDPTFSYIIYHKLYYFQQMVSDLFACRTPAPVQ